MLNSKIIFSNGKAMLDVNNKLYPPLAYTTYFDECGRWTDFINNGYKIFFVNISFTDLPINNVSGFTPFRTGVFESDTPDYNEFDNRVSHILSQCPDALIFPRINVAMPRKWIKENPYETVETPNGGARESMYSEKFLRDGAKLLNVLVNHIRSAPYSYRIAGYQLCGGTTQEWMHHDLFGSYSQMGTEKFKEWALNKYGITVTPPTREAIEQCLHTEETEKYYEFCNETVAKTVEHFAKELKSYINNQQIVGVFYGYNAFVTDCLNGLHGLGEIIDSPYIDFFSSPCCYDCNRELGFDWGDMIPPSSLKERKKLYFVECDIRTHLTEGLQKARPNEYPENICLTTDENNNKTVWAGPDNSDLSISAIRKAFAHQLTNGSGIWWFDMWGGWYADTKIMDELKAMLKAVTDYAEKDCNNLPSPQVALFIDEKAYKNIPRGNHLLNTVNHTRVKMGNTGIPFDMYMVEDYEKVIGKYKAVIFTSPAPSGTGKKAMEYCKNCNIPHIVTSEEKPFYTTEELRDFLVSKGVHCYNPDGCVIYCNNGILGVHTVNEGKVKITLPKKLTATDIFTKDEYTAETLEFNLPKHSTQLFELSEAQ